MFILRVIDGEGRQYNSIIGDHYTFIDKESQETEFKRVTESYKDSPLIDEAHGVIVYHNGSQNRLLYKKQENYIMVGNGDTFANLTFK